LPYAIGEQWCVGIFPGQRQLMPIASRGRVPGVSGSRRIGHPTVESVTAAHPGPAPDGISAGWRAAGTDRITVRAHDPPRDESGGAGDPKIAKSIAGGFCHRTVANSPADVRSRNKWLESDHPHSVRVIPAGRHAVIVVRGIKLKAQSPLPEIRDALDSFCLLLRA